MTDLITWLRAQASSDELDAPDVHSIDCAIRYGVPGSPGDCDCGWPARVLRQAQAHRAILDEHPHGKPVQGADEDVSFGCYRCHAGSDGWMYNGGWCTTVRALTSIYSDREGYREEWSA